MIYTSFIANFGLENGIRKSGRVSWERVLDNGSGMALALVVGCVI